MILLPHLSLSGDFESCERNIISYLNRNFFIIDSILQMKVIDFVETLPSDPNLGDMYILETGSYSYAYNENSVMIWDGSTWIEVESKAGFITMMSQI